MRALPPAKKEAVTSSVCEVLLYPKCGRTGAGAAEPILDGLWSWHEGLGGGFSLVTMNMSCVVRLDVVVHA